MKKLVLLAAIICFAGLTFAQSDKYAPTMKKNIAMLDSVIQNGNAQQLANTFERIGDAEKNQWLPYYYAAYCTIAQAFRENNDNTKYDPLADKAQELIDKAETILRKENSETDVIKSMIATAHMFHESFPYNSEKAVAARINRIKTYGPASAGFIEKSKSLDPTNPRAIYWDGQAKLFLPPAFGGGKDVARLLFEKAIAMFDTFKPAGELYPAWGKSIAQYSLALANK